MVKAAGTIPGSCTFGGIQQTSAVIDLGPEPCEMQANWPMKPVQWIYLA